MTLWANILKRMKSIKVKKQQSGSILVISAMMLPLMLGCLGFAYDFGNLYIHKSRLQNIADAAALAGGRAYLESRKKQEGRDTYDTMPSSGVAGGGGRQVVTYEISGKMSVKNPDSGIHEGSRHKDADRAADEYILKNIVNLGTSIKSDQYSHYALQSIGGGNLDAANSVGSPKTFYRIGLFEEVPLHFLRLIFNKKEQRVRAGAIVLVDDGKGIVSGQSVFDNLFTVKNGINLSDNVAVSDNSIQGTFDGSIVVANDTWDSSTANTYYNKTFYTTGEKDSGISIADMANIPNMGGKAVWWNTSPRQEGGTLTSGLDGIETSVPGFLNKLSRIHFDLKRNCTATNQSLKDLQTVNLSRYITGDTNLGFHYVISDSAGIVTDYFHIEKLSNKENNKLVFCMPRFKVPRIEESDSSKDYSGGAYVLIKNGNPETYYSFFTEGYGFINTKSTRNVVCNTYVLDSDGRKIFCNKKDMNGSIDFYLEEWNQEAGKYNYWQINTPDQNTPRIGIVNSLTEDTPDYTKYYYNYNGTYNGTEKSFTLYKKRDLEFLTSRKLNEAQIKYSNVFHWEWEKDGEISLTVNGLSGDESYPVYIILTGNEILTGNNEKPVKIAVTASNVRPLIFCNLTKNEIAFSINQNVSFKGVIYSPFAKVTNTSPANGGAGRRHFTGSIISTELAIEDSQVSWANQNFLKNDEDLNAVSDVVSEAQEARKQEAITYAKEGLGTSAAENWENPNWFGTLTSEQKGEISSRWNELRLSLLRGFGLDMPDWPWKEGGNTTDPNLHHYSVSQSGIISEGERLRLINFRTEYTMEPYMDPFNQLSLPADE